jgi:hypothetical protein
MSDNPFEEFQKKYGAVPVAPTPEPKVVERVIVREVTKEPEANIEDRTSGKARMNAKTKIIKTLRNEIEQLNGWIHSALTRENDVPKAAKLEGKRDALNDVIVLLLEEL